MRISGPSPLVLGSASPRRRELLVLSGIPCVVFPADVDETPQPKEDPPSYLERIVRTKLDAVRAKNLDRSQAVLVADTVVIAPDGAIMGKPADGRDAARMIERLSGITHGVSTAFMLAEADPRGAPAHFEIVTTSVKFRPLRRGEAQAYAETGEGNDKAGGYGIQGRAAAFVERIDGSYTNVVGLPLCQVYSALLELGWIGDR